MVCWNDDSGCDNTMGPPPRDTTKQVVNEAMIAQQLCRIYLMGQFASYPLGEAARQEAIDQVVQQQWHLWVLTARNMIQSLH